MNFHMTGTNVSFQFRNEYFFARLSKSRDCTEAYVGTSHKQPRRLVSLRLIDADSAVVAKKATMAKSAIAKKGHFWMETN